MKRLTGLLLGITAVLAGCGDNSKECGAGTTDVDGVCQGTGSGSGGAICGDGTMLDESSGMCVVDPASCQGGTVLIAGECKDPTAGLTADVTEAAEPNGFGVIEDSDEPAGQFELKAIGGGPVVIQGNLNPHPDADNDGEPEPDVDTYIFEAEGPTLLDVSVDGVGGVSGAFALLPDPGDDQLADYIRLGTNFTGDTTKRQLYLPKGGIYVIAIADSRTIRNSEPAGDANSQYFVSIEQKALPTATSLTLTAGAAQASGTITDGEVDVFTANVGDALVSADLQTFDDDLTGELIYTVGPALRGLSDETHNGDAADSPALVSGAAIAGQTPLFIVDHVSNTGSAAVDYRLRVRTTATTALPANGMVNQTNPSDDGSALNYLSFDTVSANTLIGLDITFDTEVTGDIFDVNGNSVFSFNELDPDTTFTHYKGAVLLPTAGRYYVVYYSQLADAGDDIVVTSKFTTLTAQTLTYNTPVTAVPKGDYNTVVYNYELGNEPWQLVTAAANAASGGATVHIFAVDGTAGTLNNLELVEDDGGANPLTPDQLTVTEIHADGGDSAANGVITPLALPNVIMVVETDNDAGTFDLKTAKRVYTDEGDHAPPYTHTDEDVVLPATAGFVSDSVRYLVKTTPGSIVKITATPTALLNVNIAALNYAETVIANANTQGVGVAEVLTRTAGSTGYIAFQVSAPPATASALGDTFDLKIEITAPVTPPAPVTFYTVTAGTTQYMNICGVGANELTPAPEDRDDGFTANQTLTGFNFYGADRAAYKVSTNGFLTFDTAADPVDFATYNFDDVPSASVPGLTIAPFYAELVNTRVCSRTTGTKTTVQWSGYDYYADANVAFQVIMDSADDTFEFVYPAYTHSGLISAGGVMKTWTNANLGTNGQGVFSIFDDLDVAGKSYKFTKTP